MMGLHKLFCTCFGIGYLGKGAGTIASLACCVCWWLIAPRGGVHWLVIVIVTGITTLGIWSAGKVENEWGKDSRRVVIDEVAGMCTSLLFIPAYLPYLLIALLLFRFFDIVKPLFIRELEKLPGGWGVMLDDILAGFYANLLMQLMIAVNLFK